MISKGFRFGMLLQIAVGPICLFIFQTAATAGFVSGETGVLGVILIDALYILAAILGIGTLINKSDETKKIMKYFGALVLVVFGLSNVLSIFGISFLPSLNLMVNHNVNSIFTKTLLLTLSNPLTVLFWAGVFSTKLVEENMGKNEVCLFGFGAVLSTAFFLTIVAVVGSLLNAFLSYVVINFLNAMVGIVLIFFGMKTAFKKV